MTELDYLLHNKKCAEMMLQSTSCPINKIQAEWEIDSINEKLKQLNITQS